MLHVWGHRQRRNGQGIRRRDFLRIGTLGLGGLALPNLLQLRAQAVASGRPTRETAVVWLWLGGGPSHLETFDPHRHAPSQVSSVVGAIRTNVPGIEIGGVFPRLARCADKMAIVRSFGHGNSNHHHAAQWIMTGRDCSSTSAELPSLGAILARQRGPVNMATSLPNYVGLGAIAGDGPSGLGSACAPFDVRGSLNGRWLPQLDFESLQEHHGRQIEFDHLQRQIEAAALGQNRYEAQAFATVYDRARAAFDLDREDVGTLELYGTCKLGRQLLLARRLCEAGVGLVTVHFGGWDMHGHIAQDMQEIGPQFDQAAAAFIQDVCQRGLEKDILLVVTGEFGRTPRLNHLGGRDHWAPLTPLVLAGGGLRMGQIVGASTPQGDLPQTTPLTPPDLLATVGHVLGLSHPAGGKAIAELV